MRTVIVERVMTDTHGQSAMGFSMGKLCGLDLCPRIKSAKDRRLHVPRGFAVPAALKGLCIADIVPAPRNSGPNAQSLQVGTRLWQSHAHYQRCDGAQHAGAAGNSRSMGTRRSARGRRHDPPSVADALRATELLGRYQLSRGTVSRSVARAAPCAPRGDPALMESHSRIEDL